jgi:nitric oxide reductase large subunit
MKRNLITAFVYLLLGAAFGVFYREFTKWNGYTGVTALAATHPHLIALGMLVFLALYFGLKDDPILQNKKFKIFYIVYNIGLPGMVMMMLVRGILQVKGISVSTGIDGMIQGIAGVFHIMVGASLVLLFLALFDREKAKKLQK